METDREHELRKAATKLTARGKAGAEARRKLRSQQRFESLLERREARYRRWLATYRKSHPEAPRKVYRRPRTKPLVNWFAVPRLTSGGYWRKKIGTRMFYWRFPHDEAGYRAAVLAYVEKLRELGREDSAAKILGLLGVDLHHEQHRHSDAVDSGFQKKYRTGHEDR